VLWAALFLHNLGHLDNVGYDAPAHIDYIDYIQTHHALPLATDGWEMCHPPLYYLLCALILAPLNLAARSDSATYVIRMFGLCLGVLHFALVFLSARLLFPKQLAKQIFCLLFAAFLPEQLYLAHYITNEFLAATLVTASIYFCLRLLKSPNGSPLLAAAAGICLGAALSTKASALVAVPFILGAVACWPVVNRQMNLQAWLRTLGVTAFLTLLLGGGHYIRAWKHFGKPIVQDWDNVSGFAWWADNGFQTASSAFGFGESLIRPFYSSFHSFADGIYSTLWGDGLYAGLGTTNARPPWNYPPMAAGYLLALVPTILILTGLIASVVRFVRRPQTSWFLLLGIFFATAAALLYMNLKLPFYCNAKAFYGLLALLPISAAAATGWETICRTSRMARPLLCLLMGTWALNAYSSYWIHPDAPETLSSTGIRLCSNGEIPKGMNYLSAAVQINPRSFAAQRTIAMVNLMRGNLAAAESEARKILSENPNDGSTCCALAIILASREQWDDAFQNARRAIQLEPDLFDAYKTFGGWLVKLKRDREAVDICRAGLRIEPMNPDLQLTLASALDDLGNTPEAEQHFRFACSFSPARAEAHDSLGMVLAKQNKCAEAIEQFSRAIQIKPNDAVFRLHLAAAYFSSGDLRNTVQSFHQTLALDPDNLEALEKLAWLLATTKDDQLRDGKEALRLAQHASELTDNKKPRLLAVLAAAYAETGSYAEAISSAQKAITLAQITGDKDLVASNSQYLELYRANRPCRQ
jgi:tetratricopeptide (TPR) repeat protein